MALIDFEQKVSALVKRVETLGIWTTRQDLDSTQVPSKPALLVLASQYNPNGGPGKAKDWNLAVSVKIYARTQDTEKSPETPLNALIRRVLGTLEWDPKKDPGMPLPYTTLGGECSRCQVAGPIKIEQGAEGGEAYAEIPVEIVGA